MYLQKNNKLGCGNLNWVSSNTPVKCSPIFIKFIHCKYMKTIDVGFVCVHPSTPYFLLHVLTTRCSSGLGLMSCSYTFFTIRFLQSRNVYNLLVVLLGAASELSGWTSRTSRPDRSRVWAVALFSNEVVKCELVPKSLSICRASLSTIGLLAHVRVTGRCGTPRRLYHHHYVRFYLSCSTHAAGTAPELLTPFVKM